MTDNIDLIRKHMPDVADHLDRLQQAGDALGQQNDARYQAEFAERQKMAAEDARLNKEYPDTGRDKFAEGGWGPKVVGGHWTPDPSTGEPMWSGAHYQKVVEAVGKS